MSPRLRGEMARSVSAISLLSKVVLQRDLSIWVHCAKRLSHGPSVPSGLSSIGVAGNAPVLNGRPVYTRSLRTSLAGVNTLCARPKSQEMRRLPGNKPPRNCDRAPVVRDRRQAGRLSCQANQSVNSIGSHRAAYSVWRNNGKTKATVEQFTPAPCTPGKSKMEIESKALCSISCSRTVRV